MKYEVLRVDQESVVLNA